QVEEAFAMDMHDVRVERFQILNYFTPSRAVYNIARMPHLLDPMLVARDQRLYGAPACGGNRHIPVSHMTNPHGSTIFRHYVLWTMYCNRPRLHRWAVATR